MSPEFLLTSLIVVLLPGTGVIFTLAIGLARGFKASVAAALGCTFGIVPSAFASIVGLAALLHASALAFQVIKFLGVIYLFYMAWTILKDDSTVDVQGDRETKGHLSIAVKAMLINVLNPKLSLFFMAFLPQFVSSQSLHPTQDLVGLAGVFMVMTFIVFVGYGAFAAAAREQVIRRPAVMRWIKRTFAAAFGFLGLRLALAD